MSHPTIKRGDRGTDVKLCQELLNEKGYSASIDSDFGPTTEKRVKEFQKDNGLGADGVVGAKTWEKLEKPSLCLDLPIDFQRFVDLFPEVSRQKYKLSGAQCPSNPPGITLKRIGLRELSSQKTNGHSGWCQNLLQRSFLCRDMGQKYA